MSALWGDKYEPQFHFNPADVWDTVGNGVLIFTAAFGVLLAIVTMPIWGPFWLIGWLFD